MMITEKEFEHIIDRSESSIIDFKSKMYDFNDDKDFKITAKFVKDILSLTNTIRNETAYIIIGIEEAHDGPKILHGLDINIDDAILQDKLKDKVFPRPSFLYYTLLYQDKRFGIIEIPVSKYSMPISPTVKMKGLEIGHIYYRQGTTNTEAIGNEIIKIHNWFQSLPDVNSEETIQGEIGRLLKALTSNDGRLSSIISDILSVSKKYRLIGLIDFCSSELQGIKNEKIESNPDEYKYRIEKVTLSLNKFEINPYSFVKVTSSIIKDEIGKSEDFFEYRLLFNQPITEIEEYLDRFDNNIDTLYATFEMSSKRLFPQSKNKDYKVTVYIFKDTYIGLYRSIRQKAIDQLMKI